jgi:hypothetical protein
VIEAFQIGISLALQDGVEEGIAKAQRDVAAVTRAVGVGATSVQRLQEAGVAALTVAQSAGAQARSSLGGEAASPPARAAAVLDPKLQPAEDFPISPVELPQEPSRAPSMAPAVMAPHSVLGSIVVSGPGPAAILGAFGAAEATQPPPASGGSVTSATAPSGRLSGFAQLPEASAAAPSVNGPGMAEGAPGPIAPHVEGRPPRVRLDVFGATGSGVHPDGDPALAVADAHRFAGSLRNQATSHDNAAGPGAPALEPEASRQVSRQDQAASAADDSGGPGPSRGSAENAHGPTQGDVFLDGALVGRWMSRLLSREASRATAGPTGYDLRRNALLPGPTVGG